MRLSALKQAALLERLSSDPATLGEFGVPVGLVEAGTEFSVGSFFDGKRFEYPGHVFVEDYGLLNGGLGPLVPAAAVVRPIRSSSPLCVEQFLKPLTVVLQMSGHVGYVEVKVSMDKNGSARAIRFSTEESVKAALTLWKGRCRAQLRLWVSPYPYEKEEAYAHLEGFPVDGERIVGGDRVASEGGGMVMSGKGGLVGFAVAYAATAKKAAAWCIEFAEGLKVPQLCYRTDALRGADEKLKLIEYAGWLR